MLIESQIRFSVLGLNPEELDDAIAQAQLAMDDTRAELGEPVALQEVVPLKDHKIRYCIRGLRTHAEKEYVHDLATSELFAFRVTYSHIDLDTIRFLRMKDCLGYNPGF